MSLNPSIYAPSDVLNAPALLYAGQGQPLTTYTGVISGASGAFSIPSSAISWSISTNAAFTGTINGLAVGTATSIHLSGSGTLDKDIALTTTAGTLYYTYTLDNVVYNTPSYY
jgi:hypothetical protein